VDTHRDSDGDNDQLIRLELAQVVMNALRRDSTGIPAPQQLMDVLHHDISRIHQWADEVKEYRETLDSRIAELNGMVEKLDEIVSSTEYVLVGGGNGDRCVFQHRLNQKWYTVENDTATEVCLQVVFFFFFFS
jgi:hypothetical protein